MLKYAEIEDADDVVDDVDRFLWRNWIRRTPVFQDFGVYFSDLEDRLVAADGTMRGQALNVLRPKIEAKEGEFKISGGEEALRYDQRDERNALVLEGILALYDDDPDLIEIITSDAYFVVVDSEGAAQTGLAAAGQRGAGSCEYCAGSVYGCTYCRYRR